MRRLEMGKLTARQEGSIPIAGNSEHHSEEAEISAIRLPPAFVRQIGAVKALDFEGSVEEQVDEAHGDVINDLGCFG
jgi:hypothetical protein